MGRGGKRQPGTPAPQEATQDVAPAEPEATSPPRETLDLNDSAALKRALDDAAVSVTPSRHPHPYNLPNVVGGVTTVRAWVGQAQRLALSRSVFKMILLRSSQHTRVVWGNADLLINSADAEFCCDAGSA